MREWHSADKKRDAKACCVLYKSVHELLALGFCVVVVVVVVVFVFF